MFLPDIWNHLGKKDQVNVYKQINRQEVEVEEEVEVDIEVEEEGEAKEGILDFIISVLTSPILYAVLGVFNWLHCCETCRDERAFFGGKVRSVFAFTRQKIQKASRNTGK